MGLDEPVEWPELVGAFPGALTFLADPGGSPPARWPAIPRGRRGGPGRRAGRRPDGGGGRAGRRGRLDRDPVGMQHVTNRDRRTGRLCGPARPGRGGVRNDRLRGDRQDAGARPGGRGPERAVRHRRRPRDRPGPVMLFGFPIKTAVGTSLFVILLPTGLLGVLEYWKTGNIEPAAGLWIALASSSGPTSAPMSRPRLAGDDEAALRRLPAGRRRLFPVRRRRKSPSSRAEADAKPVPPEAAGGAPDASGRPLTARLVLVDRPDVAVGVAEGELAPAPVAGRSARPRRSAWPPRPGSVRRRRPRQGPAAGGGCPRRPGCRRTPAAWGSWGWSIRVK